MLIEEITTTCSNEQVASAAIASIGETFAQRVNVQARGRGLSAGAFAASAVRTFADRADDGERQAVRMAMTGADQPVLSGLRRIIEPSLDVANI